MTRYDVVAIVLGLGVAGLPVVACSAQEELPPQPGTGSGGLDQGLGGGQAVVSGGMTSVPGVSGGVPGLAGTTSVVGGAPGVGGSPSVPQGGSLPGAGGTITAGGTLPSQGGSVGQGGSTGTSGSGSGGGTVAGPSDSVQLQEGGYYSSGSGLQGYCWTASDKDSGGTSTIEPPCGDSGPCFTPATGLCVKGTAAQVVNEEYGTYWGVTVGCNLNQTTEGEEPGTVSLAGFSSITVGLSRTVPAGMRVQVTVPGGASDGGDAYYCASISSTGGTVSLTDLNSACWDNSGNYFDPSTMQVSNVQIQVSTNTSSAKDFDFCVSQLVIQ